MDPRFPTVDFYPPFPPSYEEAVAQTPNATAAATAASGAAVTPAYDNYAYVSTQGERYEEKQQIERQILIIVSVKILICILQFYVTAPL